MSFSSKINKDFHFIVSFLVRFPLSEWPGPKLTYFEYWWVCKRRICFPPRVFVDYPLSTSMSSLEKVGGGLRTTLSENRIGIQNVLQQIFAPSLIIFFPNNLSKYLQRLNFCEFSLNFLKEHQTQWGLQSRQRKPVLNLNIFYHRKAFKKVNGFFHAGGRGGSCEIL